MEHAGVPISIISKWAGHFDVDDHEIPTGRPVAIT
jgi:hypothetical protein